MDAELLLRWSGSRLPSYVVTTATAAHLLFTSDDSGIRPGIEFHWEPAVFIEGKSCYI